MPDTAADLQPACSDLFPQPGIEEFQPLGPDPIPSRACARERDPVSDRADVHADAAPGAAVGRPARCSSAALEAGTQESQQLGPDPIPSRACAREGRPERRSRDAKGRFAQGHSGNPKGRPPGIRNPRRRPLGLLLRQARPGSLAPLVERKRYLRIPVLRLVLPPLARQPDPGERLGIDFSRMRSAPEIAAAISKVLAAAGRGEIAPSEALRLVRRSRKPLRAMRRQLWRDLARLEAMRRGGRVAGKFSVQSRKIPCSQGISAGAAPALDGCATLCR